MSRSAAPVTKSHPATSPNTAPATQNECHPWSASHMKRHFQCVEQVKSPANIPKYCACHAKWMSTLLYWSVSLRIYYYFTKPELLLCGSITLRNYTELLLCGSITLRNYYFTVLLLYGSITLRIYDFTKLWLYGAITVRIYYFTNLLLYESMTLRIYDFTNLLLYESITLRNYYFTDLFLWAFLKVRNSEVSHPNFLWLYTN